MQALAPTSSLQVFLNPCQLHWRALPLAVDGGGEILPAFTLQDMLPGRGVRAGQHQGLIVLAPGKVERLRVDLLLLVELLQRREARPRWGVLGEVLDGDLP